MRSPSRKENADASHWSTDSPVMLTAAERARLEDWARRPKTAQATALRARLILGCAAGKTNTAVARELRASTVSATGQYLWRISSNGRGKIQAREIFH
jgi:type IV pilus biogenesis protein CpaD/CtpE